MCTLRISNWPILTRLGAISFSRIGKHYEPIRGKYSFFNEKIESYNESTYFVGCYHHRHIGFDDPWPWRYIVLYAILLPFTRWLNFFRTILGKPSINLVEYLEVKLEARTKEIKRRAHFFLTAKSDNSQNKGDEGTRTYLNGNVYLTFTDGDYFNGVDKIASDQNEPELKYQKFERFVQGALEGSAEYFFSTEFVLDRSGKVRFDGCSVKSVSDAGASATKTTERKVLQQMYIFLRDLTHNHKNISSSREVATRVYSSDSPCKCSHACPKAGTAAGCTDHWARETFHALCGGIVENNQREDWAVRNLGYLGYARAFKRLKDKEPDEFCHVTEHFDLDSVENQINSFIHKGIHDIGRKRLVFSGLALMIGVGGLIIQGLEYPAMYTPLVYAAYAFSTISFVVYLTISLFTFWTKSFLYARVMEKIQPKENYHTDSIKFRVER